MSKTDKDRDENAREGAKIDRRGFLKIGAAGAAGAGLGAPKLKTLAQTEEGRDSLADHTGEWKPSTCAGCTSWCASEILVENGRAVRMRGNTDSEIHGTASCPRKSLGLQQVYDPDRVKQPMRRTNPEKGPDEDPEFVPITWDEAVSEIADKITGLREREETHKAMVTRGRYTYLRPILYDAFPAIVGTPNNISHSAICAEAEKAGPFFTEGEWAYRQYDVENARYVLLWGVDPVSTNRQVSYYTKHWGEVMDRAEVAVVEPRLSWSAAQADEFSPLSQDTTGRSPPRWLTSS